MQSRHQVDRLSWSLVVPRENLVFGFYLLRRYASAMHQLNDFCPCSPQSMYTSKRTGVMSPRNTSDQADPQRISACKNLSFFPSRVTPRNFARDRSWASLASAPYVKFSGRPFSHPAAFSFSLAAELIPTRSCSSIHAEPYALATELLGRTGCW